MFENEDELRVLLRESEPKEPTIDHEPLVDVLVQPTPSEQRELSQPHGPWKAIGALGLVASLIGVACFWTVLSSNSADEFLRTQANSAVERSKIPPDSTGPLADLTDEEIERQLAELQEHSIALENELWNRKEALPQRSQQLQPSALAVIEGSEALWLVSETASEEQRAGYWDTLSQVYSESSAAQRIKNLRQSSQNGASIP